MASKMSPESKARACMKSLGIYKPEFEPIIKTYGELKDQYDELTRRFIGSDYKFEEPTAAGMKKAPIVTTLESLRKDILSYAAQLGLTPQGLLKVQEDAFMAKKKSSGLEKALKGLESE